MVNPRIAKQLLAAIALTVLGSLQRQGCAAIMEKEYRSIVVFGHNNAGKSTTFGQLIRKGGGIGRDITDDEVGEGIASYLWVLDQMRDERGSEHAIDIAMWKIDSKEYIDTLMDIVNPTGYKKNMIPAVSQADCGLLIVSSLTGEFEATSTKFSGPTGQRLLTARNMGLSKIVVAVNKMDASEPRYSQERFFEVKNVVLTLLRKAGYEPNSILVVPISAQADDNLLIKSTNMNWYKGMTLREALDTMEPPNRETNRPLRIAIQDIYSDEGGNTIAVGRVNTGVLAPETRVVIAPGGISTVANPLGMDDPAAGNIIRFSVANVAAAELERGMVCGSATDDPPAAAISFLAQVTIVGNPGRIYPGYSAVFFCHTVQVNCEFSALIQKLLNETDDDTPAQNPEWLQHGDVAIVKITPSRPVAVEAFHDIPELGRFVIDDNTELVASGIITAVEKSRP